MRTLLLRAFQRLDRVDQLRRDGALVADWGQVLSGTEHAYARMVAVVAERGIDTGGHPPIWAWLGPLRLRDADLLFDADHELSAGFATVTFEAPAGLVLLSEYSDWCDVLMDTPGAALQGWQPRRWRRGSLHPEQACLPLLRSEWVTGIAPLPTSGWQDLDLDQPA